MTESKLSCRALCDGEAIQVRLVRNPRARRYILRLCPDGAARVTIPRGGSVAAARTFVARHSAWLSRQLQHLKSHSLEPTAWHNGSELLFRGQSVRSSVCPYYRIAERWLKAHTRLLR